MFKQLLDLDQISDTLFVARNHQENFRHTLFGGQVLAQALMAAGRTTDRQCHSLHAYFLRPGKTSAPVEYAVSIVRDGRSVSTREVMAKQGDEVIFSMQCSFHQPEEGYQHQLVSPDNAPSPDNVDQQLTDHDRQQLDKTSEVLGTTPIQVRPCQPDIFGAKEYEPRARAQFWMRSATHLPDDPLHHACAAAFASDIGLLATAVMPHGISLFSNTIIPASMDHSIWFHEPLNFNDWHLYCTESPWAGHARGYCRGSLFDQNLQLRASTAQEGMIRPR